MQKKQLTLVVVSLFVVIISVSLAYFTTQIIGKGKDVNVSSANLQIIFTDTGGEISSSDIEPGWNAIKTFTIKNDSKSEYKYNIVLKDLVNTFVTKGYLQYKITSTDGYNMTEFKNIPKSQTATDIVLAYGVTIAVGVTQSYTIEFRYLNDEDVNQSSDMGKKLSGTLFITEWTEHPSLMSQLLTDKTTRLTRTDFSTVLTNDNTKTLYTGTEKETTVYYFAGNATDNWVQFAGYYWRIIRTNSDGGVRLLYHGTSPDTTEAYINDSVEFNKSSDNSMYVGYMYGESNSTEIDRSNTNSSTIKEVIDAWYQGNLINYTKYLSTTAVYCNDRKIGSGTYSAVGTTFYYASYARLVTNKLPTYDCTNEEDKFTVDSSTGNGKLTYPVALMTIDEASFAGGVWSTNAPTWYYNNSVLTSSTDNKWWWTMSPRGWSKYSNYSIEFVVNGSNNPGRLGNASITSTLAVRPVISLNSDVIWASGDGSASNPYQIELN